MRRVPVFAVLDSVDNSGIVADPEPCAGRGVELNTHDGVAVGGVPVALSGGDFAGNGVVHCVAYP